MRAYREVLAIPGVARLLAFAVVYRVPSIASGVVLTLHVVTSLGRGYGEAGVVATLLTIGGAVGQPWRGRAVDRVGLRRALLPAVLVTGLMFGLAPYVGYWWLLPVVLLGGLVPLPVFTITRQSLAAMVEGDRRRTAYALDSMGVELSFMVGPALGVLIATRWSTRVALVTIGVGAVLAGLALLLFNPPTSAAGVGEATGAAAAGEGPATGRAGERPAGVELGLPVAADPPGGRPRVRWTAPLVFTLAAAVAAVLVLAGTDVGIVAFARADGALPLTGLVFVTWGLGSMAGAAVYGALHRPVPVSWLLLGLAVLTVPIGLVPSTAVLALAILPAAAMCAPVITATSEAVARLVPERVLGEAMGWHGSALTVGSALGSPLAGVAMDATGPWAGFAVVGLVGAVLAGAGFLALRLVPRTAASAG